MAPKCWSNLPSDVKREVLEHGDCQQWFNVRLCSRADMNLVDSLKLRIPFLKIQISNTTFSIIIVESPSAILRIDLHQKSGGNAEFSVEIFKNSDLELGNLIKTIENTTLDAEISNLLEKSIFHRKIDIATCQIQADGLQAENPVLAMIHAKFTENAPKKLIFSGKSMEENRFLAKFFENLNIDFVFRSWRKDLSREWGEGMNHLRIKIFEVSKWTTLLGDFEHFTAYDEIEPVMYMARILSRPMKRSHWFPGFHVPVAERLFRQIFRQEMFEKFENHSIRKSPINLKLWIFVKFTKCGISIFVGDPKDFNERDGTCDLEWMCPNCAPKTMENWFFRETIGKLHF